MTGIANKIDSGTDQSMAVVTSGTHRQRLPSARGLELGGFQDMCGNCTDNFEWRVVTGRLGAALGSPEAFVVVGAPSSMCIALPPTLRKRRVPRLPIGNADLFGVHSAVVRARAASEGKVGGHVSAGFFPAFERSHGAVL